MRGLEAGAAALVLTIAASCGGDGAEPVPDHRTRTAPRTDVDDFAALGYSGWDEDTAPEDVGAVDGDLATPWPRAWADDRSAVRVIDVAGEVRRTIEVPGRTQVEFARFLPGGRIACVSVDEGLTLLEPDGAVAWSVDLACHHDVAVVPDGSAPGERTLAVAVHHEREWSGRTVRFDEVVFVDERDGATSDGYATWSTWDRREELLEHVGGPHPLDREATAESETVYDYFHLNTVSFDGPDTMVVCLRNVDLVAFVDVRSGDVVEGFGPGELDWPHAPTVLRRDGARSVLVFDNGKHRGWSRVVELRHAEGELEVLWQYGGREDQPLFSDVRGYAQRLPGGHTLITESERGRVLEVSSDGRVVWEFWNPEARQAAAGRTRRRIYRMTAIPPEDSGLAPSLGGR